MNNAGNNEIDIVQLKKQLPTLDCLRQVLQLPFNLLDVATRQ